jgi:hypothetical protein
MHNSTKARTNEGGGERRDAQFLLIFLFPIKRNYKNDFYFSIPPCVNVHYFVLHRLSP